MAAAVCVALQRGRSVLSYAQSPAALDWVIKALKKVWVDPKQPAKQRSPPLIEAVAQSNVSLVQRLLAEGFSVNDADQVRHMFSRHRVAWAPLSHRSCRYSYQTGHTPLMVACRKQHTLLVDMLLDHGASKTQFALVRTVAEGRCRGAPTITAMPLRRTARTQSRAPSPGASCFWTTYHQPHFESA